MQTFSQTQGNNDLFTCLKCKKTELRKKNCNHNFLFVGIEPQNVVLRQRPQVSLEVQQSPDMFNHYRCSKCQTVDIRKPVVCKHNFEFFGKERRLNGNSLYICSKCGLSSSKDS